MQKQAVLCKASYRPSLVRLSALTEEGKAAGLWSSTCVSALFRRKVKKTTYTEITVRPSRRTHKQGDSCLTILFDEEFRRHRRRVKRNRPAVREKTGLGTRPSNLALQPSSVVSLLRALGLWEGLKMKKPKEKDHQPLRGVRKDALSHLITELPCRPPGVYHMQRGVETLDAPHAYSLGTLLKGITRTVVDSDHFLLSTLFIPGE